MNDARRTGSLGGGSPLPAPSLTRSPARSSSAGSAASAIRGHKSLEREEKAARKLPLGEIPAATRRQKERGSGRKRRREEKAGGRRVLAVNHIQFAWEGERKSLPSSTENRREHSICHKGDSARSRGREGGSTYGRVGVMSGCRRRMADGTQEWRRRSDRRQHAPSRTLSPPLSLS